MPKAKPFDPTKPVQTREGNSARIICTDADTHGRNTPIIALIRDPHHPRKAEYIVQRMADGRHPLNISNFDLVNVPERTTKYLRVPHLSGDRAMLVKQKEMMNTLNNGYFEIIYEDGEVVETKYHAE